MTSKSGQKKDTGEREQVKRCRTSTLARLFILAVLALVQIPGSSRTDSRSNSFFRIHQAFSSTLTSSDYGKRKSMEKASFQSMLQGFFLFSNRDDGSPYKKRRRNIREMREY
jgi:hypothetical protein